MKSDVEGIINLSVPGTWDVPGNITSLAGIEHFESMTNLWVNSNQLTTLDLSKNIALTYIEASGNLLTALDVSKNTSLTYLRVQVNQITSIDVSNNTALEYLNLNN
jgi:hypothetical protein